MWYVKIWTLLIAWHENNIQSRGNLSLGRAAAGQNLPPTNIYSA